MHNASLGRPSEEDKRLPYAADGAPVLDSILVAIAGIA